MEYQHYSTLPKLGRPKKFETVEELENQILEYFRSCFTPLTKRKRVKDPETGITEYVDVPQKDGNGEQLFAQVRPFTVTGLAVALDTTRETLLDYENKPENAAFSDTIKKAKQRIQQYAEDYLFSGKNPTGAIFNLKNNYGWVDRTETDLTTKGQKISAAAVEAKADDILKDD